MIKHETPCKEILINLITLCRLSWPKDQTSVKSGSMASHCLLNLPTDSSFVNILQRFGYSNDLFSSSDLDIAISKLPPDSKRRCFGFIESHRAMRAPNLIQFNEYQRIQRISIKRMTSEQWSYSFQTGYFLLQNWKKV